MKITAILSFFLITRFLKRFYYLFSPFRAVLPVGHRRDFRGDLPSQTRRLQPIDLGQLCARLGCPLASHLGDHAPAMMRIDLSNFRGLLERNYLLAAWCIGCRRWATCDLAMLVRNGLVDRQITRRKPRRRKCGCRGDWEVRPPLPTFTGAT